MLLSQHFIRHPEIVPRNVIMTHLAIFVAPLAFSSQQPHPRTSSAAGQAYQAGSQPHIPHTRSHACTRSPDWKSMGRISARPTIEFFPAFSLIFSIFCTQDKHKMQKIMPRIPDTSNPRPHFVVQHVAVQPASRPGTLRSPHPQPRSKLQAAQGRR